MDAHNTNKPNYLSLNFYLGVANGILFHFSAAFAEPVTVLPIFIAKFTTSSILIGLLPSLSVFGWLTPQLLVAKYSETQKFKMPYYITSAFLRIAFWLAIILTTAFYANTNPKLTLLLFLTLYTIFSLATGTGGIAFTDIVGKVIPTRKLGAFFGHRMFWGGLLGAGAGFLVTFVLGHPQRFPFPTNFVLLFSLSGIVMIIALTLFSLIKEPIGKPITEEKRSFLDYLKSGLKLLQTDKNFYQLLRVQLVSAGGSIALPFYIIFAQTVLQFPKAMVGIFLTAQMTGNVLSNILWGYLSDHKSNKLIIQLAALLSFLVPIAALTLGLIARRPTINPLSIAYLYTFVFILMGFTSSGAMMGYTNYLLEISPESRRPTYIGLMNTLVAPAALLPVLGGIIADLTSYQTLFYLSAIPTFTALIISTKLKEPRAANPED